MDASTRTPRREVPQRAAQDVQGAALLVEVKRTNHLLAVLAVKGMEQRQAITFLDGAGFRPAEIAIALGITPNAVSIALHRIRKAATVDKEPSRRNHEVGEGANGEE